MNKTKALWFTHFLCLCALLAGMYSGYTKAQPLPPERPDKPIMPIRLEPPEPPIMPERVGELIRIQPHTVDISVPQAIVQVAANEYHYRNNNRESNTLLMWALLLSISIVIAYFWKEGRNK